MNEKYQERYRLELLDKTLRLGRWIAFAAVFFITIFYLGDISDLELENTLPLRLTGIIGALIYLVSRLIPAFKDKAILFYSIMMLSIIFMMSGISVQIFTNPDATQQQLFAVSTGSMSVWLIIALIAYGGRRIISNVGIVLLLGSTVICIAYMAIDDVIGFIVSIFMAGFFAIVVMRTQENNDRERAFSVYALQDSRDEVARQAEDLRQANENLLTFTRAMSHDLQSPLRRTKSFLDLFRSRSKDRLPEDTVEFLDLAENYLHQGQQVVADLLVYAKIGKNEINKSWVALTPLCEQIASEQLDSVEDQHVSIRYEMQQEDVLVDEKLIWYLLSNLVSNAVKFTRDQEQPVVTISCYREAGEDVVCVADNGVGFDEKFLMDLWEPFKRLHGSQFAGTGIGLSIVSQIAKMHRGRFWAQSPPGEGARFYCAFPIA